MKKTILITGTSSGIGKATALYFAERDWNVIATMRSPEKGTELTRLDNVLVARLDVQQPETITAAIGQGIDRFGQVDVLVNNAGYGEFGVFEAATEEQVRSQFEVNVFGVMNTIRTLLPHLRERKQGMIINISSGAGRFTLPMLSLYASSKFALEGFSEALSFELAALNIVVKIVEPGGTHTNFTNVSFGRSSNHALPEGYGPFVEAAGKQFASLVDTEMITAGEVAAVIYRAVTDGKDTLRYVAGSEGFRKRLAARFTMPDQAYVDSVKNGYLQFMPQP
jgi:NAD(P)-dependent dehydrogenase (short-subunit alcohol dehydrogenase family)